MVDDGYGLAKAIELAERIASNTVLRLSHEMAVSFFPNWVGQRQVRLVEVDGKRLQLSTDGPQRFKGTLKTATMHWRRAKPNF
jgi:Lipocalin-like domain